MWTPILVSYIIASLISITFVNSLSMLIVVKGMISPEKIHLEVWRDSTAIKWWNWSWIHGLVLALPVYHVLFPIKCIHWIDVKQLPASPCGNRSEITIPTRSCLGYMAICLGDTVWAYVPQFTPTLLPCSLAASWCARHAIQALLALRYISCIISHRVICHEKRWPDLIFWRYRGYKMLFWHYQTQSLPKYVTHRLS